MTSAVILLVVLLLTVTAYYPGLSGDYLFDDIPNLLSNKEVQITTLDAKSLKAAMFSAGSGIQTRALSMLTFAFNYYFFGVKPFSFKLVNLFIHLLNGVGLFILANQLLNVYRRIHQPELTQDTVYFISLATAAAWLFHPLNLTGVLYIVQRMTSLATLFMIAGLCFYVWGRSRLWDFKSGLHLILIGLLVFGPLALLSKENGALLPLFMFVIEISLFRFRSQVGRIDKRIAGFFVAALLLPAIGCMIWLTKDPQRFLSGYAVRPFNMEERLLTEARVLVFYLRLIFAPSLAKLGFYHDDIAVSYGWLNPLSTLPSVITVIALLFSAFFLLKKSPLVSLGILWFFTGQLLESTILPLEIAFEHRNYLADFGVLFAFFFLLLNPAHHPKTLLFRRTSAILFITLFFAGTFARASHWDNNVDQAIYDAAHHPRSARATYSAGRIYANLVLTGQRQYLSNAYDYLQRSRKLDKYGIMTDVALILFSTKLGAPIDPSLIADIKYKLSHYPISPSTISSLRELAKCQETDCKIDNRQMASVLTIAVKNPWVRQCKPPYGDLLTLYGSFLIDRLHEIEGGKHFFEMAVNVRPNAIQYRLNLIRLLLVMNRYDDARAQLRALEAVNTGGQFPNQIESLETDLSSKTGRSGAPG